jgi:AAA ATPase domain
MDIQRKDTDCQRRNMVPATTIQPVSADCVPVPAGRLIGRWAERGRLADLTTALAAGRGGVLLVEGEVGMGKSVLLREACAAAAGRGCTVLWAACDEAGRRFALEPLLQLSVSPQAGAELEAADPVAAAAELVASVDELCATGPVLLAVDDLQWADAVTAAVWHRLVHVVPTRPLLLLGATRQIRECDDLRGLRRATGRSSVLRLGPLSGSAGTELVRTLAGGRPGPGLRELADGVGGNPLRLTTLVEALARDGRLVRNADSVELAAGTISGSLVAAVADRLELLRPPVVELLRSAALLGEEFHVADLAAVLRRQVAEIFPLLGEALIAGALTDMGQALAFRPPLIQAVLYDELPAAVSASWHAAAARALACAGTPAERVAQQLLRVPDDQLGEASPWVFDWLADAAPALVEQAPRAAVLLLRRGLSQLGPGDPHRERLTHWLVTGSFRLGEPVQGHPRSAGEITSARSPWTGTTLSSDTRAS